MSRKTEKTIVIENIINNIKELPAGSLKKEEAADMLKLMFRSSWNSYSLNKSNVVYENGLFSDENKLLYSIKHIDEVVVKGKKDKKDKEDKEYEENITFLQMIKISFTNIVTKLLSTMYDITSDAEKDDKLEITGHYLKEQLTDSLKEVLKKEGLGFTKTSISKIQRELRIKIKEIKEE
jgi:hypothetical protein